MLLIIGLALILLTLCIFVIFAISVGGAAFIIIFGDVIVCIGFITWIIYKLIKMRKNKSR